MSYLEIATLAVALALDAFSVSASLGPRAGGRVGALRLAGTFGGFQAVMPMLGAVAGASFHQYVRHYDHWVAFGVLELVGLRMVLGALAPSRGRLGASRPEGRADPSSGLPLLGLGLATSLDAFGAGMGLHMAGADLWAACPLIGAVTAALSYLGARLGERVGRRLGPGAELAGGIVLMALGIRMLRI